MRALVPVAGVVALACMACGTKAPPAPKVDLVRERVRLFCAEEQASLETAAERIAAGDDVVSPFGKFSDARTTTLILHEVHRQALFCQGVRAGDERELAALIDEFSKAQRDLTDQLDYQDRAAAAASVRRMAGALGKINERPLK